LVEKIRSKDKMYHTDTLFAEHGHTVIRLPPHTYVLNPTELAWRQKDFARSHNTPGCMLLTSLQELVQEAIKGVAKEDWAGYYR
jgi:hypothetical protein